MLNKVILIGRLANEPELKWTPSGIPVTTFRLAVERPMSSEARQAGQEKQADFIDIVAWRQQAEFASNYLGKGRLVSIEGRLHVRQYQASDGSNRRSCEVVVDQLKSLERPRDTAAPPDVDSPDHAGSGYRPAGEAGQYSRAGESGAYARRPTVENGYSRGPAANRSSASMEPDQSGPAHVAPVPAAHEAPEIDPFTEGDLDDPFADS